MRHRAAWRRAQWRRMPVPEIPRLRPAGPIMPTEAGRPASTGDDGEHHDEGTDRHRRHGDEPDVISYGADGQPGGSDLNADIVSWK